MSEKALDLAEAASGFLELIERTTRLHEVTIIVDKRKPLARVVPVEAPKTTGELLRAWNWKQRDIDRVGSVLI